MVKGDWPDLEYLVIGTGVRVLRVNESLAGVKGAVQALTEARSALPEAPTAADVSQLVEHYAAHVAPFEAAATTLETEIPEIGPGHSRILDIIDDDREATGVAEEYLGGAVSLGAAAVYLTEDLATFPGSLEELGRTVPPAEDATTRLASAWRRMVVALEPAVGWADRSAAILADWP